MDQDAFRTLLASSRRSQANAKREVPRTTANSVPQKAATSASSEPAFKPRKVKKTESKYRDRAAERREGIGNDYAQVEAVLEDFEKRVAHEDKDVIGQQRKYLGGDSQHTVLVKGLDMSLLEQNRARATTTEDDETLEQAFAEATFTSERIEPRKRTREDIIRDLKIKRQNEDGSAVEKPVEEDGATRKTGKFRPIGFKPIGQTEEKEKKRRIKKGKESMNKKQKVEGASTVQSGITKEPAEETPAVSQKRARSSSGTLKKPPEPEPAPLDEDFDIFAGAGDYEGFPGDEESEEYRDTEEVSASRLAGSPVPGVSSKSWFDEPKPEVRHASIPPAKSPAMPEMAATEEETQEMRIKPLESSAIPSIRDFLAMDEAAEKAAERKARKEKKKRKNKVGEDDDD